MQFQLGFLLLLLGPSLSGASLLAQSTSEDLWFRQFEQSDLVAKHLIDAVDCVTRLGEGLNQGTFQSDSALGPDYQCLEQGQRKLAILAQADSTATRVLRLHAMDRSDLSRYLGPVDTVGVLQMLRASRTGIGLLGPLYQEKQRDFAPFTIRGAADSIEVWLLPVEMALEQKDTPVVGGETAAIFSPQGDSLARRVNEISKLHGFTPPDSGVVRLGDPERDFPLMTELILAHWLNAAGRTVTLETRLHRSTLSGGSGSAPVWLHFTRSATH